MAFNIRYAFRAMPEVEILSALPGWISLRMKADLDVLEKVVRFFRKQFSDLPPKICEDLSIALHELLSNAMEHGCGFDPSAKIELTFIRTPRLVLIEIRDNGCGFSLENLSHTALNNPPEEPLQHTVQRSETGMRPGGFGILLAKQAADELIYNERGNAVILIKYLPD